MMSHHQNVGQKHDVKMVKRSIEIMVKLKYLVFGHDSKKNKNLIHNSGNACYHSVHNLLSSLLPCKNVKIEYKKLQLCL
jgi:hypothetical protein